MLEIRSHVQQIEALAERNLIQELPTTADTAFIFCA